jgi:NTP pyrophosphatase (non-canonical NTP hydrolase)
MDYISEATKTLSNQFHGKLVSKERLMMALGDFIHAANELDKIKKALFYGRKDHYDEKGMLGRVTAYALLETLKVRDQTLTYQADNITAENLFHGIVGAATEAGELVEALFDALTGKPLDLVNIKEEVGDAFWYYAILARECDFTFENAQEVNIAKLRKRFPNMFTEHHANNRNLEDERKILEQQPSIKNFSKSNISNNDFGIPEHIEIIPFEEG